MSGIINTEKASTPLGAYPHARRVGNLLFLSGIGPRSPKDNSIPGLELDANGDILKYDIKAETHAVFANVKALFGFLDWFLFRPNSSSNARSHRL